jgi:hypothetical protein
MTEKTSDPRGKLAARLAELTKTFRFRWGEPAVAGDDEVELSAVRGRDEQDGAWYTVVGVATSHRLRPHPGGLRWSVRQGDREVARGTVERGWHFRLHRDDVPAGELEVALELLPAVTTRLAEPPGERRKAAFEPRFTMAAREPGRQLVYEASDGRFTVRMWQSQVLALEVAVQPPPDRRDGVVRVTFRQADEPKPMAVAYVGLDAEGTGRLNLDGLDPHLPDDLTAARRLTLELELPPAGGVGQLDDPAPITAADRELLERCRAASIVGGEALAEAIARLDPQS